MNRVFLSLAAAVALLLPMKSAEAAVIGTYVYDYTDTGNRSGQGRGQNADGVLITDDGTTFRDGFDFSALVGATIDSFELTFAFSGAGPTSILGFPIEQWNVVVEGADPFGSSDDLFATLVDGLSPWSGTIDAATAPGSSFFSDAVANLGFDFSFEQTGLLPGSSFRLAGVELTVNGTAAVVPLPAPGLLLLAALAGLGLMRRRAAGPSAEIA